MSVPVYLSRHQPNPSEGYGAFVDWQIGEPVILISRNGRPPARAMIKSEVKAHYAAPVIDGAHGRGSWVCEVRFDGEDADCAVSTAQITFAEPISAV